jgi:amino acid adenylation domain-containing protein
VTAPTQNRTGSEAAATVAGIGVGAGPRPGDGYVAVGPALTRTTTAVADIAPAALAALAVLVQRHTGQEDLRFVDVTGDDGARLVELTVNGDDPTSDLLRRAAQALAIAAPLPDAFPGPFHGLLTGAEPTGAEPPVSDLAVRLGAGAAGLAVRENVLRDGGHQQLASSFTTVFEAFTATGPIPRPATRVTDLDLLTDTERDQILYGWNETGQDFGGVSVPERIARHAIERPHAVALEDGEQRLTFAGLETEVARLAAVLAARGVTAGDNVAVVLDRSAAHVVAQLAVFRRGASVVLIDVDYPADRVALMFSVTGVATAITDPAHAGLLPAETTAVMTDETIGSGASTEAAPTTAEQVSHIAFTSGSTGVPKAVLLRHGPFGNTADALIRQCGIDDDTRSSWMCSPGFGLVEVDFFPVLAAGGTVIVPGRADSSTPETLRNWLLDRRITHSLQLTAMAERLWTLEWPADTPLRWMPVAGERVRAWPGPHLPFRVLNVYGSAEANVVATSDLTAAAEHLGDRRDLHGVPIGRPVPNVRIYVLDERLRPVPPMVRGELFVSGESLSAGYLNRDEETSARFLANPVERDPFTVLYRTGDSARYWADGTVEIIGRQDDELKIRGYRVHPAEIEAVLSAQPGVRQCAVVPREVVPGEQRLVAYVERDPMAPATTGALREALGAALPPWMLPSAYVIGELPSTPNGKIDRAALPPPPRRRPDVTAPFVAPRTELEAELARFWAAALDLDDVGVLDDFLELGGDSLRAMRLLGDIHRELKVPLEMSDLLTARSVAASARIVAGLDRVEQEGGVDGLGDLPTIEHDADGRFEPFPLSETQQALWIGRGSAVEYGDVGCHGYFEWERAGLDVERFRRAWGGLLDRHDMLRTVIRPDGTQVALAELPHDGVTVLDHRDETAAEAERLLLETRAEMSHVNMDPATWPLFDVRLTLLPGDLVRLHIGIDLLLMDAWSAFQVLFPDLIELYENPDRPLPELGATFRDYMVNAQRILRASPGYARAEKYWRDRLPTLPPAPDLPMRNATDAAVRFDRREHVVDALRWAALKERANTSGITPNGMLVAVFSEVMRGWARNDRFTINFPIFERWPLHPDIGSVLGDFTNTVLVAVEKTDGTFAERARDIQAQLWTDMDHRQFNGVEVLRELSRMNGGALRPAMPVVVTSLLGHPPRRHISALGRETYGISQTPQVTLDFQIREIDDALHFKWDFLAALFPPGMIDAMFDAYVELLDRLLDDEESWNETRFALVPPAQQAVRDAVNDTAAPVRDVLLQEVLAEQARRQPDHEAVVDSRRRLTYGDLNAEATRIGHLLQRRGVATGELVGIVTQKGWEAYPAVYGVLAAGAAYLPIDAGVPADRLEKLLRLGNVSVVLTQPWLADELTWPQDVTVLAVGRDDVDCSETDLVPRQRQTDPAYVIYTSGSTGEPKGVTVDHRGVVNMADAINELLGVTPDTRAFGIAGLHFDMSIYDVFGVIAAGGTVVLPDPFTEPDPDAWLDLVKREHVTFWSSVPQLAEMLATREEARDADDLVSVRQVVLSGDFLPLDLPDRLRALTPRARIYSAGGPTETICWSIVHPIGEVDRRWPSIPYGVPIANQRYHIVDARLDHRPDWAPGEMVVAGDVGLAHGYWRDPDRTAQRFFRLPSTGERVYATGDIGRYLPDGSIEIVGRDDFQVKVQGYRIELGEIESALAAHPTVGQAVVTAPAGSDGRRRLVAFVTPDTQIGTTSAGVAEVSGALAAHLRERLPGYMVPADIRLLAELPLTGNGKVDRRALDALAATAVVEAGDGEATALEQLVGSLCAETIGAAEPVPPGANFFAAGGDSLTGTRLINRITEIFGIEVPLKLVFTTPTIGEFCAALAADPENGAGTVELAETLMSLTAEDLDRLVEEP